MQPTGAAGVEREFEIWGIGEKNNTLYFTLITPFARHGWGNDNFLLRYEPIENRWYGVVNKEYEWGEIPQSNSWSETNLHSICFGELHVELLPNKVKLVSDQTPYHLDNWDDIVKVTIGYIDIKSNSIGSRVIRSECDDQMRKELDELYTSKFGPLHRFICSKKMDLISLKDYISPQKIIIKTDGIVPNVLQ